MRTDSMRYETVRIEMDDHVARVVLFRPKIRNAFNEVMIAELREVFSILVEDPNLRVVVLTGAGTAFCAGADLNWMRRVLGYTYQQNLEDSLNLARLMREIYEFPRPVIGRINGPAIGGGTGLVAACDIAVAAAPAVFSFSEVKIGLVPACISPYVIKKIGEGKCREFFLTGERLMADRVLEAGLVNRVVPLNALDEAVDEIVAMLLSSGPAALKMCKDLIEKVSEMSLDGAKRYTAEVIASLRMSPEGQEGMAAFLEKRKPNWVKE